MTIKEFALKPFRADLKVDAAIASKHPLGAHPSRLEECHGNWSIERTLGSQPYFDTRSYEALLEGYFASASPRDGAHLVEGQAAMFLGGSFFENYAHQYEGYLIDSFWKDFRRAQAYHVALGGSFFPIQEVFGLDGGWFLTEWRDASFNSSRGVLGAVHVQEGLPRKLRSEFSEFLQTFNDLSNSVAEHAVRDKFLRTFAEILMMAREQAQQQRIEVAFFLSCTALECLFVGSIEEPIASTLSKRLGVLQSLALNIPFRVAVLSIKKLYDFRSRFAHDGETIDPEHFEQLFSLCLSAYQVALQASLRHPEAYGEREQNWRLKWHKTLDYLGSAFDAGKTVDGNAVVEAGIAESGVTTGGRSGSSV